MGSIEKLVKSLEALKVIQAPIDHPEEPFATTKFLKRHGTLNKKEKLTHCVNIAETISTPNLSTIEDFQKFLGITLETLLFYCDDEEADVRTKSTECLNRVIKNLMETHSSRILIELYKEIKKNASSRSLRTGLSRFCDLCHLIRSSKRRAYLTNLLPCFIKVIQRTDDESVQDTLYSSLPKLLTVFGKYSTDQETSLLIRTFVNNLRNKSASIRRFAASNILCVIENCKRPSFFLSFLFKTLIQVLNTSRMSGNEDDNSVTTAGIFQAFKTVLPILSDDKLSKSLVFSDLDEEALVDNLTFMYEMILDSIRFERNQIILVSALECLAQIMKTPPKMFLHVLLRNEGLQVSRVSNFKSLLSHSRESSFSFSVANQSTDLDDVGEDVKIASHLHELPDANKSNQSSPALSETTSLPQDKILDKREGSQDDGLNQSEEGDVDDTVSEFGPSFDEGMLSSSLKSSTSLSSTSTLCNKSIMKLTYVDSEEVPSSSPEPVIPPSPVCLQSSSESISSLETCFDLIGNVTDSGPSIEYCSRLVCYRFLLTGKGLHADSVVRVSVKSLAVGCIASIVKLTPHVLLMDLFKKHDPSSGKSVQRIIDLIQFRDHSDPVLKSQVAQVVSSFIESVLTSCPSYNDFLVKHCSSQSISLMPSAEDLLQTYSRLLQDKDSHSLCMKNVLTNLQSCLPHLLKSKDLVPQAVSLLETALNTREQSYWLIRVELLNLVSLIDFKDVSYFESQMRLETKWNKEPIQDQVLSVIMSSVSHDDHRIRAAAASCFKSIVRNLFLVYPGLEGDPITALASQESLEYLSSFSASGHRSQQSTRLTKISFPSSPVPKEVFRFAEPFARSVDDESMKDVRPLTERNLEFVVNLLQDSLTSKMDSKTHIMGCIAGLDHLSSDFSPSQFPGAWTRLHRLDFCRLLTDLLTSSSNPVVLDLSTHQRLLSLLTKLLSGFAYDCIRRSVLSGVILSDVENNEFGVLNRDCPDIIPLLESLFSHVFRLLYVTSCIIKEVTPQVTGPTTSSNKQSSSALSVLTGGSFSPIRRVKNKDFKSDSSKKENSGNFLDSNMYRLHDILKSSHESHRLSSDFGPSKFTVFTENTLKCLGQLLEMATIHFIGRGTEILVDQLKILVSHSPKEVISVTQSILRALFGTSFTLLMMPDKKSPGSLVSLNDNVVTGVYETCFSGPFAQFSQATRLSLTPQPMSFQEEWIYFVNLLKRTADKRVTGLLEKNNVVESGSLSSYIKFFEPIVIKALKMYTTSCDSVLQAEILHLVSCLLQVRVNYWLLDSDQVFLEFVLRQFQDIVGGFIESPESLVDSIFNFLCLLSHERFGSKQLVSVSKIIHMSDSLFKSNKKLTLIAMKHLVLELFFFRTGTKSDSVKDFENQKEAITSTLLKLSLKEKEAIPFLTVVVNATRKDADEKWKKASRTIIDDLLLNLKLVASVADTDDLLQLFESASPLVFRPVDVILKGILTQDLSSNLILLKILVTQAKEDVVLTRISKLLLENKRPSEEYFALILLQMVSSTVEQIDASDKKDKSLVVKVCHLLLYMTHMFQSGSFRRVARAASLMLKNNDTGDKFNLLQVNEVMCRLSHHFPLLVLQWTNILLLLGLNEEQEGSSRLAFFSFLSGDNDDVEADQTRPASLELIRKGSVILLCDFACESAVSNAEQMTWLIINHIHDIIHLSHEITIKDFIHAIHRNPASSALFIQSINAKCFSKHFKNPTFATKLMDCIRFIHPTQSGSLVVLLIEKIIINSQVRGLIILQMAAQKLCLERLDMIVRSENVQEMQSQLSAEDVGKLLRILDKRRYRDIVSALETFLEEIGGDVPVPSTDISVIPVGRQFYVDISIKCCNHRTHADTFINSLSKLQSDDVEKLMNNLDILSLFLRKDGRISVMDQAISQAERIIITTNQEPVSLKHILQTPHFLKNYLRLDSTKASKEVIEVIVHLSKTLTSININHRSIETLEIIKVFCFSHHKMLLHQKDFFPSLSRLINSLFSFISNNFSSSYLSPSTVISDIALEPELRGPRETCMKLSQLLSFVLEDKEDLTNRLLKPVVLSLCRVPSMNAYIMVPPVIWIKKLWNPNFIGDFKTICPTIPSEELKDTVILSQFTTRIRSLGWISRIQFEELWMSLLGVISLLQQDMSQESNMDDCEMSCITVIAINGLIDLLTQSLLTPIPGNPVVSELIPLREEKTTFFTHTKYGQKLSTLKESIMSLDEEAGRSLSFKTGHVSINSLRRTITPVTPSSDSSPSSTSSSTIQSTSVSKSSSDIDLPSCVHFLTDLLHQLSSNKLSTPPILVSVIKAAISLSDLFFERSQFEKLLETFFSMYKQAVVQEDEEQLQSLSLGILKCASVLSPVSESTLDKVKKCVENGLRSSFLSCRIKTLLGIKYYLIETPEIMKAVNSILSEYLMKHLGDVTLPSSKNTRHVKLMWEVSFLLIEKSRDDFAENEFGQKILSFSLDSISRSNSDVCVEVKKIVANGLEKLLMNDIFAIRDADQVTRISLERMRSMSPSDETTSFCLMLTALYVFGPSIGTDHKSEVIAGDSSVGPDEDILEAMEKIAVMFDRLKVCCPHEAKVISTGLPCLLVDFFPTQDILNKVIGEFVSSQQLYPHLLADIVFSVFSFLRQESKGDIIQEWVMLSLSSFSQLEPLALSVWSLTSFLICASEDPWIKTLYPCVRDRFGRMDELDVDILSVVSLSLYSSLSREEDRDLLITTLRSIADNDEGAAFHRVISFIRQHHQDNLEIL